MMRQVLQQERGRGGMSSAWVVLSMVIMAVAAEPKTDFPKAQVRSVPAVRMVLHVAGGLTVAGVPVLLIALP
jgi:hypothetical protein